LGEQNGLIITDNQTRGFDAMSPGTRKTHVRVTWGDYANLTNEDFFDLGFRFDRKSPL
jgi:hypothetical protein